MSEAWWKSPPTLISAVIGLGTIGSWVATDLQARAVRDYQFKQLEDKVNRLLQTSVLHEDMLSKR